MFPKIKKIDRLLCIDCITGPDWGGKGAQSRPPPHCFLYGKTDNHCQFGKRRERFFSGSGGLHKNLASRLTKADPGIMLYVVFKITFWNILSLTLPRNLKESRDLQIGQKVKESKNVFCVQFFKTSCSISGTFNFFRCSGGWSLRCLNPQFSTKNNSFTEKIPDVGYRE